MPKKKHFIDTSIIRPMVTAPQRVKTYFQENLPGEKYYCSFILMEFTRGFILPAIDFYFTLKLPNILNIEEAIELWSNKFQTRQLKSILNMFSGLLNNRKIDFNDYKKKELASKIIADYIRRIISSVPNKFKDIGTEKNLCSKSSVNLYYNPEYIEKSFTNFRNEFNEANWKTCQLENFANKHLNEIEKLIDNSNLKLQNSKPNGFNKIIEVILKNENYTCKKCNQLGDFIIAIISPKDMILEHTDYSFDYLMNILEKKIIDILQLKKY